MVEKQALAFRLDPAYLRQLGQEFTADLPEALPFRVTFFFSRFGAGYHIGFSDIARGGWRTVIARSADDYITSANTLFREVYVLAHTQHLKNKDIYEGGSKMALVLDASDLEQRRGRGRKTAGSTNCSTASPTPFWISSSPRTARSKDRRVVDYYGDDEPIEIGPDENMHDGMIEAIAALSKKRGYILGIGIMSSKRFGINHKEYGVTSTGVVTFAEITMAEEAGIDISRDRFSLKMTGGPNGDVAGNCLRIMLERCPAMQVRLILDGTAALYDPDGINRDELRRIVLAHDLDAFDPACLGVGWFYYLSHRPAPGGAEGVAPQGEPHRCRAGRGMAGYRRFQPRVQQSGLHGQEPISSSRPAGGRRRSTARTGVHSWMNDGIPSARVIVEGANSFITPEARVQLQKSGVVIMRDASANKCGVISSSYEIIANLLLSEREFMEHKERYVGDVLAILEKRAADEARLILRRQKRIRRNACSTARFPRPSARTSTASIRGCSSSLPPGRSSACSLPSARRSYAICPACCRKPRPSGSGSENCRKNTSAPSWPPRSVLRWSTPATATRISRIWSGGIWRGCCRASGISAPGLSFISA